MAITIKTNQKIQSVQIKDNIYMCVCVCVCARTRARVTTQIQMIKLSKCQKRYLIKE